MMSWQAYFNNVVIPRLNKEGYTCGVWKAGQYPYICLVITKTGYGDKRVPYLEIRSRDCHDNQFQARVLCYGVDPKELEVQQPTLIKNIEAIEEWNCKGLVTKRKGKPIFPKQVGCSNVEEATNDEQFISLTEKYIALYLEAIRDWK